MATPQVEDGHSMIANELLEAIIKTHLSPAEHSVFWAIVRKTYGWHKKTDRISFSQFEELTGMNRRHIAPALHRLLARNIIIRQGEKYNLEYGIQKDYELWQSLPKSVTKIITENSNKSLPKTVTINTDKSLPILDESLPISETIVTAPVTKSLPISVNTKERNILTKENTKEKSTQSFEEYKEVLKLRYPELDFDNEFQKWHLYWYEGNRKCKNPKLALHNWLDKAREFKKEGNNAKTNSQNNGRILKPDEFTDPGEYFRQRRNEH